MLGSTISSDGFESQTKNYLPIVLKENSSLKKQIASLVEELDHMKQLQKTSEDAIRHAIKDNIELGLHIARLLPLIEAQKSALKKFAS